MSADTEIEYSAEQQADIERMIRERVIEDREKEHRAIAGDQAYRLAIYHIAREVQTGLYDPEILKVLGEEWERFKTANPIRGRQSETQNLPESP